MANVGRARRRSDDRFRRHDGGAVSDYPHRPPLVLLLADSLPERAATVGELPVTAHLGCLRDHHLPDRECNVSLPRFDTGHRRGPRPMYRLAQTVLPSTGARLARLNAPMDTSRGALWLLRRAGDAVGCISAQCRLVGLRDVDPTGVAQHDLRTLLRSRCYLLGPRDGDHPSDPAPEASWARGVHHRLAFRESREVDHRHVADHRLRVRHRVLYRLV